MEAPAQIEEEEKEEDVPNQSRDEDIIQPIVELEKSNSEPKKDDLVNSLIQKDKIK